MKIVALSVYRVPLTSHETYYMAAGKQCATVDTIVLRIDTDSGLTGWGEVCPIPHYLPAYAGGVAPAIAELESVLIGANPLGAEALIARCDAYLPIIATPSRRSTSPPGLGITVDEAVLGDPELTLG